MQLLMIEVAGERAAELAVLADEMTEDPRCQLVLRGLDEMEGASANGVGDLGDQLSRDLYPVDLLHPHHQLG